MPRLVKAQKDIIEQVANGIVLGDLLQNGLKDMDPELLVSLRKHLKKQLPELFQINEELAKQIKVCRTVWIEQLKSWKC